VQIEYMSNGGATFVIVEKQPMPKLIEAGKVTPVPPDPRPEPAGAKDYAAIPRLPGQHLNRFDEQKFDSFDFPLATGPHHRVEGHKMKWGYDLTKGGKAWSDIHARESYRQVLTAEGWAVLMSGQGMMSAVLNNGDKHAWAQIEYNGGSMWVTVVEPSEMKQVVSASNLLELLKREGHVSFEVHFDTGKDEIKAESKSVIAQMVELLKADATIKVEVQGHTDAQGNEKDNQALSERRAKSVMAALTTAGIEAARLTAKGYGQTKPVADNDTEGGRALNRRVELAKR
jgi:outer membrane protein OmpA-like peptidoglycan-associated protein